MHLSNLLATACLAASTQAAAAGWPSWSPWFCLSDSDAKTVSDNFSQLLSNYSTSLADQFLSSGFTEQSDSLLTLRQRGQTMPVPLGSVTYPSKDAFKAAQAGLPKTPFKALNTSHSCTDVFIRYVIQLQPQQVQGFALVNVVPNPDRNAPKQFKYQAQTVYSEFNSGAWFADIGRPECQTTNVSSSS